MNIIHVTLTQASTFKSRSFKRMHFLHYFLKLNNSKWALKINQSSLTLCIFTIREEFYILGRCKEKRRRGRHLRQTDWSSHCLAVWCEGSWQSWSSLSHSQHLRPPAPPPANSNFSVLLCLCLSEYESLS